MRQWLRTGLLLGGLLVAFLPSGLAAESQIVAGAGPSTGIVKLFIGAISQLPEAQGVAFNVMESSVKHAGGIKNSDVYLFGRSGRPLNDEEKASGKREILLGEVQLGFAVGREVGVKTLPLTKLRKIYSRQITNWREVGGTDALIVLAGREANEAALLELKRDFPWFKEVSFDQVFKKDDDLNKFLVSPLGRHALAFGVKTQLPEGQVLEVTDFKSGLAVGLIYDQKHEGHPLVKVAKRYSGSKEWKKQLATEGYLPLH